MSITCEPDDCTRIEHGEPHAYDRACRNTQHSGCTCMHLVDGRWCGKLCNDPIHTMPTEAATP